MESTENLEKAVSLNPNDTWPLQNLYFNYQMQRDFAAADRVADRALALVPDSFNFWTLKARTAIAGRGDFSVAEKSLAALRAKIERNGVQLPPEQRAEIALAKGNLFLLQRQYADALQALSAMPNEILASQPHMVIEAHLLAGVSREKLGESAAARAEYAKAKEVAETAVRAAENEPSRHILLARALAHLGGKDRAIVEAKRAVALLPESVDAFEGPGITQGLAKVYAITGENAEAIRAFEELLSRPSDMTVALLRLDPVLEDLRQDPSFEQMLAKHEKPS